MTYHSIYKIGGLCLNMKYIVMILGTKIKYTLIKSNIPLQRNASDIFKTMPKDTISMSAAHMHL